MLAIGASEFGWTHDYMMTLPWPVLSAYVEALRRLRADQKEQIDEVRSKLAEENKREQERWKMRRHLSRATGVKHKWL